MRSLYRFILLITALTFLSAISAKAQDVAGGDTRAFSLGNPDGAKYEFAKAYLSALEQLYQIDKTDKNAKVINETNINNFVFITTERDRLINANVNLRIARNLLDRFERSDNALINSVVASFGEYTDKQIELNNQERLLVETIRKKIIEKTLDESVIKWYADSVTDISKNRKESSKQLLESSLMVNKVLISHQFNRSGQLYKLGITKDERRNLLKRLRQFSDEGFKGEIRSGQTFLEASISSIRQILEDTKWPSIEEI